MKAFILAAVLATSGCAVGDIEGTGRFGEVARSANSTYSVLTGASQYTYTTSKINRAIGHTKSLAQKIDGNYPVAVLVRDVTDLMRYMP